MLLRAFFLAVIGMLVGGGPALADGYLQGRQESGSCCFWSGFYVGVHGGYASGTLLPPTRNAGLAPDILSKPDVLLDAEEPVRRHLDIVAGLQPAEASGEADV